MQTKFELLLFSADTVFIKEAIAAGIDGILVDCENLGKENRQVNFDTEINLNTPDDVRRVRSCTDAPIVCRINGFGQTTREEIEQAIDAGTTEILVPMVRRPQEIVTILDWVNGRCGVGMMLETIDAAAHADEFGTLPLTRAYVGLHDLFIERKSANLFVAVADGLLERIRANFRFPFGFGGITLPDRGTPIPCRLFMGEMARLNCQFSFLRRAFHADTKGSDLMAEMPKIRAALDEAFRRPPDQIERERAELYALINSWK